MKIEMWPIERPIDYARNARKIEAANVAKMAALIKEFGFRQPVVVDKEGVIVVGHLRRAGARQAGCSEIPVHVARDLTKAQCKAYRLADNRSGTDVKTDFEILALELSELRDEFKFDLSLTAFEQYELDPLLAAEWRPDGAGDLGESGGESASTKEKKYTIELTKEQHSNVGRAIIMIRKDHDDDSLTDGQCVEMLAAHYATGALSERVPTR